MKSILVVLAGCALTQKSAPVPLRYFDPPLQVAAAPSPARARTPLRIGRVSEGALLGTRIVHRDSPVESEPYDTLRWSDEPEVYVRRALDRALFGAAPFEQTTDGEAPALDIDIVAFEEVRRGARRFGRVELRYELHDDTRVVARGTVVTERAAGAGIDGVVAAIGHALDDAAAGLASRVADEHGAPRTSFDGPLESH